MAGYNDTKRMIIETLMGRPSGEEIQPENHQAYALNMLNYIRSVELVSANSLEGIAEENTVPIQPNNGKVCYMAGVSQNKSIVFHNFIDSTGNPIAVTTGDMQGVFVILLWNSEYWTSYAFETNIISSVEHASFYYNINIKKTYDSIADMEADALNPIGIDGMLIKLGDIVTVVNDSATGENGFYSRVEGGWKLQNVFNFLIPSDWNETDEDSLAYIKNKPTIVNYAPTIAAEVTRAKAAEVVNASSASTNATGLAAEITRAKAAEVVNAGSATTNATAITNEVTRAKAAESTLTTNVTANKTASAANTTAITAEVTRAKAAEVVNASSASTNATGLAAEITRAKAAEALLSTREYVDEEFATKEEFADSLNQGVRKGFYFRASDDISEIGITYIGFSATGTEESDIDWDIKRFDNSTGLQTIASGSWADRLTLTYS